MKMLSCLVVLLLSCQMDSNTSVHAQTEPMDELEFGVAKKILPVV